MQHKRTTSKNPSHGISIKRGMHQCCARASAFLSTAIVSTAIWCLSFGISEGQTLWFAPQAPFPPGQIAGAPDYMKLFSNEAAWRDAMSKIAVMQFNTQFMLWVPDETLRVIVDFLRRHHMKLAVASLAQSADGRRNCGQGVEGYGSPGQAAIISKKAMRAGGTINYVVMDEPLFFGHYFRSPTACNDSIDEVAGRVADVISVYTHAFPGVTIGDIEPAGAALIKDWDKTFRDWLEALKSKRIYVSFLRADINWGTPTHLAGTRALWEGAKQNGLRFGVIYNGDDNDVDDKQWFEHAEENFDSLNSLRLGCLDNISLESWVAHPSRLLPEYADLTFTHLILSYVNHHEKGGHTVTC